MSDLAKFRAEIDASGLGVVEVNGREVDGAVQGFSIQSRLGQPPLLILQQLTSGVVIEGEGIVRIPADGADSMSAVLEFLNSVDAEELEREVLATCGWGEGNTMAMAIDVLRKWARGPS